MYTGEIAGPLSAHKMQGFVAGISVAYVRITEQQRAGPAIDRTTEEGRLASTVASEAKAVMSTVMRRLQQSVPPTDC
jgi:hypothetical protein